jgi:hypothetical protein
MSTALTSWRSERAARLDELLGTHPAVGGQGRGRSTSQLNRALVLLLAAEVQGFARDLHELGSTTFACWAAAGNRALELVIKPRLTESRQLDHGNAHPGSLGADFGRLGMKLWPILATRDPAAPRRQADLQALNEARNAIAHANETQLADLRLKGSPITLSAFRSWRRSMDGLAGSLDAEVAAHLGQLFRRSPPW